MKRQRKVEERAEVHEEDSNPDEDDEKSPRIIEALEDADWIISMEEELRSCEKRCMGELVPLPDGYSQVEGVDFDETFAPVARLESIRLSRDGMHIELQVHQMDVKSAFLNGILQEEVYVAQPKGFEDPTHPRNCGQNLFTLEKEDEMMMVQIYVDDIIFGGTSEKLVQNFREEYDKGVQDEHGGRIEVLSWTSREDVDVKLYRGMIGSLLYLTASRPDLCFSVGVCARYQAKPKQSHLQAVKKILRYVKGTVNLGIFYSKGSNRNLAGYCDADWAGCADDRKSTSGGCFFLGNNLIAWLSKKQNSVSLSTAEAEYIALGSCCTQLIWMRQMSADYGMESGPFLVYCDNKSAIDISKNPVQHSRTKHIDIRHHFVRELVEEKQVPMRISYFVMPSCHLNIRKVKTVRSTSQQSPSTDEATEVATTTSLVVTADGVSEPAEPDVLERHKAKKGEIEDATGLTQIVNQSGSASGRMDGLVAELSGA
ncbi:unnamed protein product [Microthlaspi erraticum]|uniref:Reverse transcriptase Ty1/copia-type domain-containing protein n=1 Tax=Microthlaspi erraticum TaxID=1685480 RepID=A0A6D2KCY7_9BRAS|nr:unnamed protein product [Microthlaspi erraticum]